jgi:hypothetical protein
MLDARTAPFIRRLRVGRSHFYVIPFSAVVATPHVTANEPTGQRPPWHDQPPQVPAGPALHSSERCSHDAVPANSLVGGRHFDHPKPASAAINSAQRTTAHATAIKTICLAPIVLRNVPRSTFPMSLAWRAWLRVARASQRTSQAVMVIMIAITNATFQIFRITMPESVGARAHKPSQLLQMSQKASLRLRPGYRCVSAATKQ